MIQFKKFHIPFIPRMGWFISGSVLMVSASLFLLFTKGLNFGTDFKGGVKLQYKFPAPVSEGTIRELISPLEVGDFSVQRIGKMEENRIVIKIEKQEESHTPARQITEGLSSGLKLGILLEQEETVGPKAGADLRKKAQLAVIVSWILMLIYIGYRFDFSFAPGAIIALIHDVIITLGGFALTQREMGLTGVAALLTIIGYSINDTIIVYDRIRENMPKLQKNTLREITNLSINETFSRTIITSFTVLLVVVVIFLLGEGDIQSFGFAMIIGTVVGTYSSIAIASPLYILLKEHAPRIRKLFSH